MSNSPIPGNVFGSGGDFENQHIGNNGSSSLPKAYIFNDGDHLGLSLASIPLSGPNYMALSHL